MKKITLITLAFGLVLNGIAQKSEEKLTVSEMPADPKKCFEPLSINYAKKINKVCFLAQMNFTTQATYSARMGAAVHGGPKATVSVKISNLTDSDYKELVEELQKIAEEKFGKGGYEIVGYDALKATKTYQSMADKIDSTGVETKIPTFMKTSGATYQKTFTAHNAPVLDLRNGGMKLYKLSKELNSGQAFIIYTIDFSTYDVDKERIRRSNIEMGEITFKTIEKISIEAIPIISLSGEVQLAEDGKLGGIRNWEGYGSLVDFIVESKKINDNSYEWVVNKEAYKKTVISLVNKNLDLAVKYFSDIRK